MRNNHISYIEYKTNDLGKTKEFYTKIFGWEFKDYGSSYASFSESGVHGGFELSDKEVSNGALVVIYSKDLEFTESKVKKNGGKITKEIFEFPGGRRFHFTDPTGNELGVWSDK